jgi:N-acetylglucosaminyldiphosphoundecaprenol N-acetyl-beta-D-mannosaminyltransferase
MEEFCKLAVRKGYTNFFYGGAEGVPELLIQRLKERFPGLKVVGIYSPLFKELDKKESAQAVDLINKAKPDVLWVGLGCPKQQLWMYEHKDEIDAPLMVGVGAAFDFLSGIKIQAPPFLRNNGFEWLFRLMTEPRRLWYRYLVGGSMFIYYLVGELIPIFSKRNKKKVTRYERWL